MTIEPEKIASPQLQNYLQGIIAPRPIAFVSTVDSNGNVNLSPFSFFNLFSINPPIVVFSPSRRGRDNTTKHTHENILEVPEVVVNVVNFSIVQQTSLASTEYPRGINEFIKAGLTPVPSILVAPPRVKESPASLECSVQQVIPLGDKGGAGNLVICKVLLVHINDELFDVNGHVDPYKLDAVARMGNNWYCRAQGDSIFNVPKPLQKLGIGVDQIPEAIFKSKILTGNDLGMLGNVEQLPDKTRIAETGQRYDVITAHQKGEDNVHQLAQQYLKEAKIEEAWAILLSFYEK